MPQHNYQLELDSLSQEAQSFFLEKHSAREKALALSRRTIQLSANAIRSSHRQEFEKAVELLENAKSSIFQMHEIRKNHPEVYFSGFIHDSQKEYAEAHTTLALICGTSLPKPEDLNIPFGPYLNGLGEAIGEMRRYILDSLRKGENSRCEDVLDTMDQIYTQLFTMDFPEAITGGLRRTTDAMRGILERTRGDLTNNLNQQVLETKLDHFLSDVRDS